MNCSGWTSEIKGVTGGAKLRSVYVAGVDVGGVRNGFHVATLRGPEVVACTRVQDPRAVLDLCREACVEVVAVDAPCAWAEPHAPREAERLLGTLGLRCFRTPSADRATRSRFYDWMHNGQRLYQELMRDYPLLCPSTRPGEPTRCCFETFPHAVASAALGRQEQQARKRYERLRALQVLGIAFQLDLLRNQDEVDAALCGAMAWLWLQGQATVIGDSTTGYLVLPHSVAQWRRQRGTDPEE